jgi:hypothetical protein
MAWIKWDNICLKREKGGLGVRRIKEFNCALLGKWVWRILEENESLWCRVLQAKFGQEGGRVSFMEGVGSNWWRALNQVRSGTGFLDNRWLVENIVRRVGDGSQTLFWKDPWLDDCPFDRSFRRLFDLAENKLISVSEMCSLGWGVEGNGWRWRRGLRAWEEELLRECVARLSNVSLQVNEKD